MLPELLLSVSTSMQDLSREEFNLLHGDKDSIIANTDSLERLKLGRTPDLDPLPVSIKLEDPADAFPWQTTSTDIGSNLLRHSDDPLISGATGDNQNEFDTITTSDQLSISSVTPSLSPCKKSLRTRKKGQVKLRFHHQAIPQEYLDHYSATQSSLLGKDGQSSSNKSAIQTDLIDQFQEQKINESVQNWLQKVSEFQEEKAASPKINLQDEPAASDRKSSSQTAVQAPKKPPRILTYKDLPYMGEMTLENSKPRRGRKPKKADICHLIYKNYGTIFPDKPTGNEENEKTDMPDKTTEPSKQNSNKIISSLLEKRLTQEKKRTSPTCSAEIVESSEPKKSSTDQPLNLCIRDNNYDCDILTVSGSSEDEDGNDDDDENCENILNFKKGIAPLVSPADLAANALLASNLKMALPNFPSTLLDKKLLNVDKSNDKSESGYQWPIINPMALYLHNIADASSYLKAVNNGATSNSTSTSNAPDTGQSAPRMLVPKKISQLIKVENLPQSTSKTTTAMKQNPESPGTSSANSPNQKSATTGPVKRKRSAIFIPPLPEESSTNHATEVSICKFKFTGGAKPSLQEKKMLSVDAGGNFRYYSGTGDKSIRGYEFFPRESLQQSSLMACSSAGAFLNATGQKIPSDLTPPSQGLSNELLQIPDIVNPNISNVLSSSAPHLKHHHRNERRKRKSKRSLQRENLEKTFKEKGFLIQTQQLESAEGATYCKFRQLRKFTRYLFRSWKDYLPGELQQNQQGISLGPDEYSCIDNLNNEATTSTPLSAAHNE